jgi:pimeloyl-ACP methyl ester carboxylesterase
VVFEADAGRFSLDWAEVQPGVAAFTRACAYDRAGLGWSQRSRSSRDAETIATELGWLLSDADIPQPVVLVAEGAGGLYARVFAGANPGRLAGLVLVEAPAPSPDAPGEAVDTAEWRAQGRRASMLATGSRFGLPRLVGAVMGAGPAPTGLDELPEEVAASYRAVSDHPGYWSTAAEEIEALPTSAAQAAAVTSLGDLPLVVLSRPQALDPDDLPASVDPATVAREPSAAQAGLAALSTAGEVVVVEPVDGALGATRPEAVVDAVRRAVERARGP